LYDEWVNKGNAPALPETLKNYNKLVSLGFKIIFLSGRTLDKQAVTEANLKKAGYHTWEKLILKSVFFFLYTIFSSQLILNVAPNLPGRNSL